MWRGQGQRRGRGSLRRYEDVAHLTLGSLPWRGDGAEQTKNKFKKITFCWHIISTYLVLFQQIGFLHKLRMNNTLSLCPYY